MDQIPYMNTVNDRAFVAQLPLVHNCHFRYPAPTSFERKVYKSTFSRGTYIRDGYISVKFFLRVMFKFYNNWNDSKCQNLILFNQFFNSNFSLTNLKREISVLPRNFKRFCLKYIWLIFIIYFIHKEKVNLVYEMSIQTENKSYKYYMKILIETSIWNYLFGII